MLHPLQNLVSIHILANRRTTITAANCQKKKAQDPQQPPKETQFK